MNTAAVENIQISAEHFRDLIHYIHKQEFGFPFTKLRSANFPDCYNSALCDKKHKDISPKSTTIFGHSALFTILDNPFKYWDFNLNDAIYPYLRPEKYLRSDILRVLFDYILNGPSEDIMYDAKNVVSQHIDIHPPCQAQLTQFYKQLLFEPYQYESYFKTELSKIGVFVHVLNKLEGMLIIPESDANEGKPEPPSEYSQPITFELLEHRWNNYEPLFAPEYAETLKKIDEYRNACTSIKLDSCSLNREDQCKRLIIALNLVIDVLEHNFLICLRKLKTSIYVETNANEESNTPFLKPLVICYYKRVLEVYEKTQDKSLWTELSRLLCIMIETEHLFWDLPKRIWNYPNMNDKCFEFADMFANIIINSNWSSEEKLDRLLNVSIPWLRMRAAMMWANKELKVNMGTDLKALVEIIHMQVISPVKLEKEVSTHSNSPPKSDQGESSDIKKRAKKRNQYGETILHQLCKKKKSSFTELEGALKNLDINVNETDNYGWTALHEAVNLNSVMKVKLLLNYKPPIGKEPVDIAPQNNEGLTPLHEAVSNNDLPMCELLLERGGVRLLRINDSEGETPFALAKKNPIIKKFFEDKLKMQERLNLRQDSLLNLPDHLIRLLMMAFDAFNTDYKTKKIYEILKNSESFEKLAPSNHFLIDRSVLLKYKNDQDQFRKLRKIISKLAENPNNSSLLKQWDLYLQSYLP